VVAIHAAGTIQVDPQTGLMSGSPGPTLKQYRHDALGCRVRTTDPSGVTRHVYGSGAEVLAEYAVGGTTETILHEFVWGESFPDPLVLVDYTGAGGGTFGAPQRFYLLKDVQGSVGALADSTGQVVERYTHTPYGRTAITAADGTTPRTESLYGNPFAYTGQRYEPPTRLCHFWARVYSPTLGRFLQEDAQGVLATADIALGYQGGAPSVMPPVTGPADEYPDLMNLYAYAQGNPLRFTDPLGLDSWDEDIDDLIDDVTGQRLYSLGMLNEGAKWASIGLNVALNIAWGLVPGSGLYDAYKGVASFTNGQGGFWEAMDIAMAALPAVKYASKGVNAIWKAKKFKSVHCNCFVAGTLVETPEGSVPIEQLDVGDEVCTRHHEAGYPANGEGVYAADDAETAGAAGESGGCRRVGRVTRVFRDIAPAILWLSLANGGVLGVTPGHPLWTHQAGWMTASAASVGDTLADGAGMVEPIGRSRVDEVGNAEYPQTR